MKKFAVIAIAAFAFADIATAADLPVKAPVVSAPAPFSWTGFYVGANAGYMWARTEGNFAPLNSAFPWDAPDNTVLGGVQVGFNWQFSQFVIGVEGSLDGAINNDPGSTIANSIAGPCGFVAAVQSCQAKINNVASAGGRLGWAPWAQWLFFAQGGWARAEITTNGLTNATNVPFSSASNHHDGWFVGGGIDYALTPIVSVGVDYKHYDFGGANYVPINPGDARHVNATADAVFARVNFKLWGPGALIH